MAIRRRDQSQWLDRTRPKTRYPVRQTRAADRAAGVIAAGRSAGRVASPRGDHPMSLDLDAPVRGLEPHLAGAAADGPAQRVVRLRRHRDWNRGRDGAEAGAGIDVIAAVLRHIQLDRGEAGLEVDIGTGAAKIGD